MRYCSASFRRLLGYLQRLREGCIGRSRETNGAAVVRDLAAYDVQRNVQLGRAGQERRGSDVDAEAAINACDR